MLNIYIIGCRKNYRVAVSGLILYCVASISSFAQPQDIWTLENSIKRVLKVAPEMKVTEAQIGKQQGKLEQAGTWPNPSVSIQVDNTLGLEDVAGGYNVTQYAISQPLPFGRLKYQRQQAAARLASIDALSRHQQLLLEHKVAQRFHIFQLAKAKLLLAKKRLQSARRYQNAGGKRSKGGPPHRDVLVRYLTPLETMRLDIVLQAAKQITKVAEGEFNEAAASFKALLGIPIESPLNLMPLTPVPTPKGYYDLGNTLQDHPALEANKQIIVSSQAGVAVAKSQRFADPTLTLSRGEGFYANRRQESTGIMLSIQMPLWNRNNGRITQARYAVQQAQAELHLKQRELKTNLHKSFLHLGHLIDQAEHYRSKLLSPAQRVFTLTRKGFEAGELNILTLIDANNTWFDAQARYLELLQEGWLELAKVRRSAGLSLLANNSATDSGAYIGEVK